MSPFQCPCCNYVDLPIWRHAWHKRFTDVTNIDSLREYAPELAKKIEENPSLYFDGIYNYKLSKRGYVVRILRFLAKAPSTVEEPHRELWHPPYHDKSVNQCRLFPDTTSKRQQQKEVQQ